MGGRWPPRRRRSISARPRCQGTAGAAAGARRRRLRQDARLDRARRRARPNLFDRVEAKTGIDPFGRLVEQVMTTEPYASARRVFWVVDSGSSHAGQASIRRMQEAHENATLVHLPVHAS